MIFPAAAQQASIIDMDKKSAFQAEKHGSRAAAADDDDDDIFSVRSLCPCLPCDGSLSSIGSSTGVENLVAGPKSGRSNACSAGNLASMEDSTPSDGHAASRVKLMCSFGGKIMPRPSDGKLRYVGGETRIASVNRDSNYVELMTKMCELCEQSVVLKYQMPDEDMDALISVCNQEDLENMMEEFDRLETADGLSRLRVFLFPSAELELDYFLDSAVDPRDQEQQYIDAVNGNLEAVVRREAGPSDLSASANDLIGSYPRDSTSSDLASLVHAPSSALPVPTSRPASPRNFVWLKQTAAGPIGQSSPSSKNHYSAGTPQVSDDTASSEQHHLQVFRADLQQKILQAEDARRGTPPSAAVGDCGGHLHQQALPSFASDAQSSQQQVLQRSPSFGNCLCHPVPPAAGYHVVSARASACLAMQGRSVCVHRQHQVQIPAAASQAPAIARYQGPHSPCCCDRWWLHQRLTCPHCGLVLEGQVVNAAPLVQAEAPPASYRPTCPVVSAFPEAARFVQNGSGLQQQQSPTQPQRDGVTDILSVSPTSAAEALANLKRGDVISADGAPADKGTVTSQPKEEQKHCTGVDKSSALIGAFGSASAFPEGTATEAVNDGVSQETGKDESDSCVVLTAEKEAISRGLQTIKNDDLEEIRQLGSGTFGTVFYGKWRGSDVAIKRIKPSFFGGSPAERDKLVADFWREAGMLSNLHHPNVVAFYGVVPDGPDGTLATVTEYMVNGSLKQVLHRKDRTIDRRKRLLIAMDAAFGMEYLHEKQIVHFDLKCENLLVNMRDPHRPICKVGDFGLSKVKHQTMVSGGVRGTLPWMAPELLTDTGVTEKIDVFSFGVVMWELLTGEEPYARMHQADILRRMMSSDLRPEVPDWCEPFWRSLMERCWAADPNERPSFSEVARELRSMAASLHPNNQPHQHEDGSLQVYSTAGRRAFPSMLVGSPAAFMDCHKEWELLLLTRGGTLHVWDLQQPACVLNESLLPLVSSASGASAKDNAGVMKIISARFSQAGAPLIVLANGHAFLFHMKMRTWLRVADDTFPSSSFVSTWPPAQASADGELATLQKGAALLGRTNFSWARALVNERYQTRAHLEDQMASALALNSPEEYRQSLVSYTRFLAKEADEVRLREICEDLLGPLHVPDQNEGASHWQPYLMAMKKRELLRNEVLPAMASNRAMQRLLNEYLDLLSEYDLVCHPSQQQQQSWPQEEPSKEQEVQHEEEQIHHQSREAEQAMELADEAPHQQREQQREQSQAMELADEAPQQQPEQQPEQLQEQEQEQEQEQDQKQ